MSRFGYQLRRPESCRLSKGCNPVTNQTLVLFSSMYVHSWRPFPHDTSHIMRDTIGPTPASSARILAFLLPRPHSVMATATARAQPTNGFHAIEPAAGFRTRYASSTRLVSHHSEPAAYSWHLKRNCKLRSVGNGRSWNWTDIITSTGRRKGPSFREQNAVTSGRISAALNHLGHETAMSALASSNNCFSGRGLMGNSTDR